MDTVPLEVILHAGFLVATFALGFIGGQQR